MHVTLVNVLVKPAHIENFIAATRLNHEASIQEPGNCRFDVLQSPENPSLFILYEAYDSAEAAAAHKQTSPLFSLARYCRRLDGAATPGYPL